MRGFSSILCLALFRGLLSPLTMAVEPQKPEEEAAAFDGYIVKLKEDAPVFYMLVIQFPRQVHTVQVGETVYSIAGRYGLTLRQLYRNNPILGGEPVIYPGQTLVISYEGEREGTLSVNGYAYPFISKELLQATIPYLTFLTPFTYGFGEDGHLVPLGDQVLVAMALEGGAAPMMHLSTLNDEGHFSGQLAADIFNNMAAQDRLIENIIQTMTQKGYVGLDVDFEYIPEDAKRQYPVFLDKLTRALNPLGFSVLVALAPKTYAEQPGTLYESHDYRAIGAAVNEVLLMTYEWGYAYGPPMAVSPIANMRAVIEYALTEIPTEKIWLGLPNYGYDWPLPYVQGQTRATSLSSQQAIALAIEHNTAIQYDTQSQSPFFFYENEAGEQHVVWFEDARSMREKLALIRDYDLRGGAYWNLMRHFPQNWRILNALYTIREP